MTSHQQQHPHAHAGGGGVAQHGMHNLSGNMNMGGGNTGYVPSNGAPYRGNGAVPVSVYVPFDTHTQIHIYMHIHVSICIYSCTYIYSNRISIRS